ncbi:MAG TPA: type II 3-dehydroquinate dehydratase [Egibacteraceae bacterium]|nr:type II 3-dehydroquinate dehydratase [Egibacteraceae bacterium]
MRILILNGPNLSQLGHRDPAVYGSATLDEVLDGARGEHDDIESLASESEGELIARLHAARSDGTAAVVINPGALTHYSYALRDALEMLSIPKVEVHLSQTHAREEFRRHSVVSPVVDATITGAGAYGYRLAVRAALHLAGGAPSPEPQAGE